MCPDYTARLIAYDVDVAACPPSGQRVQLGVPSAAAMALGDCCVPSVLVTAGIARSVGPVRATP